MPAELDPREFRQTLGLFPTGVAIVTTRRADGTRVGMTVNSFNAVSLKPPLVLFSVARSAPSLPAWESAEAFAVNILAAGQEGLSGRFARAGTDKWEGLADLRGPATGAPLLEGTLATLECRTHARYPGGDHLIVLGEVNAVARRGATAPPLVFFASRYRHLADETGAKAPPGISWRNR
ncbi:flavin reductase family protein [Elioraea sp.]|jgi:flavin reductase (DIM6/NTAB) family NADH-FMN oxidoreductase RutF|uniref:flavin reductase family protein n=1 Tax=Elioraea sp. TaxID=2185103 RepID=UPI003F721608